jgi:hypothetical protein
MINIGFGLHPEMMTTVMTVMVVKSGDAQYILACVDKSANDVNGVGGDRFPYWFLKHM